MPFFPEVFLVLLSGIYGLALLYAWVVWRRIPSFEPDGGQGQGRTSPEGKPPLISVVVAARNEAANIGALLTDLGQQTLPSFEVLVSDDHSEDDTCAQVSARVGQATYPLRLLMALPGQVGKKAAVARAIGQASGELIMLTDADCRVGKEWLATIWQFYKQFGPQLIAGPITPDPPKGWLASLQVVEQVSLTLVGAVSMALGRPNMANAANLAYPRSVFAQIGGFAGSAHIASGDDAFVLQKVAAAYPGRAMFVKSRAALVRTLPQASWPALFQQRKRWASKWRHHGSAAVALPALLVFAYHLACVLSLGYLLLGFSAQPAWILGHWLLKWLAETILLRDGLHFIGQPRLAWGILALQPFYSFYVVFTGIAANFGSYEWKGRRVRP
jgi:cellulose synthase/poly-beta-1,6-N-acetylglucosamine synthase-like glycosyltransferase